jgi:hypothetical protein
LPSIIVVIMKYTFQSNTFIPVMPDSYISSFVCTRRNSLAESVFSFSTTTTNISTNSKQGGRLPGLSMYDIVKYNNMSYIVFTIQHKKEDIQFVIDSNQITKVLEKSWHLSSGKYIATHIISDSGQIKELYLHTFLKENEIQEDMRVIHISGNALDNRFENLRIVKSDDFVVSTNKRKRNVQLPADCGFLADDIPTHINYTKASGEHGDRFVIEIPKINIYKKLSSSKKIPLKDKLEEAKKVIFDIYKEYPEIDPNKDDYLKQYLIKSFSDILNKSKEQKC